MENIKTLASLRLENNLFQRDLAQMLNIQPGTIGMCKSGKRTPPLNGVIEIAKLFNVPVEKISFSSTNCTRKRGKE